MNSDSIKNVLTNLGYKLLDCGNHWRTSALYRGGSNPTALCVYKDSGTWIDYVNNSNALPLKTLVSATINSNDDKDIKKAMGDFTAPSSPIKTSQKKSKHEKTYPDSCLDKLLPHYSFYKNKGISEEILQDLKGGLATQGSMYQRFVFPIYSKDSLIHGFSGRDMSKKPNKAKWKHMGSKTSWIYPYFVKSNGVSLTADSINEKGFVILVESIGDMIQLRESGIYNVLVSFGTSISSTLLCFLVGMNPKKIFISFNNDLDKEENRGEIGAVKSYLKLIKHFDPKKVCISLPTKNDFGDMTPEEVRSWINSLSHDFKDCSSIYNERIKYYLSKGSISNSTIPKKYLTIQ